jgi:succinate dehydrogenase / fumarate reductase cytochrome b subunit
MPQAAAQDRQGKIMADVKARKRPLSPHLQVYRPQITSVLSIAHRVTGVSMALGGVLIAVWLLALASGPEYFAIADGAITSWFGTLIMLASTWALAFHLCNGIRHLWWDLGYGFELDQVTLSGQVTLVVSGALTLLTWFIVA